MSNILESIDDYIQDLSNLDVSFDEELFERALNFIVGLDPEQLDDNQLDDIISILDDMEIEDDITEAKRSKKSPSEKKKESRKYWRMNKSKIKLKRKKFKKSAEGRKLKRKKGVMASVGKTPTGRRKLKYNV